MLITSPIRHFLWGKVNYLPVMLILLIYVAPLISMAVSIHTASAMHHHSAPVMDMSKQAHRSDLAHHDHQAMQAEPHDHGWCGYCDLLASIAATVSLAFVILTAMLVLMLSRIDVAPQLDLSFAYLFPTPRAPPVSLSTL